MTNKDNLQQELKEKIKAGIKPSDLKKHREKEPEKTISPSPIVENDEGYESEEENIVKTVKTSNQEIKNLQTQISSLKRQLQTYQDFKEADLKIKEKYKKEIEEYKEIIKDLTAKIKEQYKTIEDLQKQVKNTVKDKEPVNKSFFCDSCQLTKTGTYIIRKVDSPFEPRLHRRICYLCSSCSPYVKELSEPNFDKDNNPYKIE